MPDGGAYPELFVGTLARRLEEKAELPQTMDEDRELFRLAADLIRAVRPAIEAVLYPVKDDRRFAIYVEHYGRPTARIDVVADKPIAMIPAGAGGEWPLVVMESGRVWSLERNDEGAAAWGSLPHLPGTYAAITNGPTVGDPDRIGPSPKE